MPARVILAAMRSVQGLDLSWQPQRQAHGWELLVFCSYLCRCRGIAVRPYFCSLSGACNAFTSARVCRARMTDILAVLHTAGVAPQGCYLCLSCRGKLGDLQLLGQRFLVLMVPHP